MEIIKKWRNAIFVLGSFLFAMMFFLYIHPLVILDADDWAFLSNRRTVFPEWGAWNPSRVLPEILMPFSSAIGRYVIMPINGDYLRSLEISYAIVISLVFSVYVICFKRLIKRITGSDNGRSILVSIIFIIFHFWIYRGKDTGNQHLLYSKDVTRYFFYTIPNMINACLVMLFISEGFLNLFKEKGNNLKKGFIIVLIYFCVFSNLYPSVILMAFIGKTLLDELIQLIKRKRNLLIILKERWICLLCVILWGVSLIYETSGGRAESFSEGFELRETAKILYHGREELNAWCVGVIIITIIAALAYMVYDRKRRDEDLTIQLKRYTVGCIECIFICGMFCYIMCSRTKPQDITRADILYSSFLYLFILFFVALVFLMDRLPSIKAIVPLGMLFATFSSINGTDVYLEPNMLNISGDRCREISQYVIDSVLEAESEGEEEVVLKVPYINDGDNWPFESHMEWAASRSLYTHGITKNRIKIKTQPDKSVNRLFDMK